MSNEPEEAAGAEEAADEEGMFSQPRSRLDHLADVAIAAAQESPLYQPGDQLLIMTDSPVDQAALALAGYGGEDSDSMLMMSQIIGHMQLLFRTLGVKMTVASPAAGREQAEADIKDLMAEGHANLVLEPESSLSEQMSYILRVLQVLMDRNKGLDNLKVIVLVTHPSEDEEEEHDHWPAGKSEFMQHGLTSNHDVIMTMAACMQMMSANDPELRFAILPVQQPSVPPGMSPN